MSARRPAADGREGTLAPDVEPLVRASAAIGAGRWDALENALRDALEVEPARVEEALLQSHLFAGYPATIRAFGVWRDLSGARALPPEPERAVDFEERGERVCARVYGGQYPRLRANVAALHPELERWMVRDGYGRVLGRPGLPLAVRELCVVALLCGQDAEPQLYAHMRGALQAGAAETDVEEAVRIAAALLPTARGDAARGVWEAVRGRVKGARA